MANEIPTTQQLKFLRFLSEHPETSVCSLAEIAQKMRDRKRIAVWMMFEKLQDKGWVKDRKLTAAGKAWIRRLES